MKKHFILNIFIFLFSFTSLYAIPGVESFIKDSSGEYVYYRDYTFTRESYIGILYYDDSTYQIRYYAPKDDKQYLPEKEIAILLTINPNVDYWEMTGERIISTIMPIEEDTDIVNYLHDILYDMSAKRKRIDLNAENPNYTFSTEYPQFGGIVTLNYESYIPIFNLESIRSFDDTKHGQFDCVTIGQLTSSEDKSFDNFYGFNDKSTYEINQKENKKAKEAQTSKQSFEKHQFMLDSRWQHPMDNMWLCGDDAIITCSTIPPYLENQIANKYFIIRKLVESSEDFYVNYQKTNIVDGNNILDFSISMETYQSAEKEHTFSYRYLTFSNAQYDLFNFSAYKKPYEELQGYYMNILNSYKHN